MLLRHQVNQATVEDEEIAPAVVVEIVRAAAPTRILRGQLRDARLLGDIGELLRARVSEQPVVLRIGHPEVRGAAILEVHEDRPHGGRRFAILPERGVGVGGDFLEGAVALVVEQEILGLVVGHVDIGIAVAVEIGGGHAHGAARKCRDAGLLADIDERSVTGVVIQEVRVARVIERPGVVVGGVVGAVLRVELDVAADKEVDAAVAVVVQPRGVECPAFHVQPGLSVTSSNVPSLE